MYFYHNEASWPQQGSCQKSTRIGLAYAHKLVQIQHLSCSSECLTFSILHILLEFNPINFPWTIQHAQFLLQLAYATMCNSSQGSTLDEVVLILCSKVFSQGQLYYRVYYIRHRDACCKRLSAENDTTETRNVVYQELLFPGWVLMKLSINVSFDLKPWCVFIILNPSYPSPAIIVQWYTYHCDYYWYYLGVHCYKITQSFSYTWGCGIIYECIWSPDWPSFFVIINLVICSHIPSAVNNLTKFQTAGWTPPKVGKPSPVLELIYNYWYNSK